MTPLKKYIWLVDTVMRDSWTVGTVENMAIHTLIIKKIVDLQSKTTISNT